MSASGLGRNRAAAITSAMTPVTSSVIFFGSISPVTSRKTPAAARITDKTVRTIPDKAGYSGTAVFTRRQPLSVTYDFGDDVHRHEGRVITAEFEDFYLVCCYTPNSKDQLARLDYRMAWEDDIRAYLMELDTQKPVVYCGDLNVAHQEIDLKNPKSNRMNPGFSDEERDKMTQLLASGFVDTFRALYPDRTGAYSWWSYRFHARENNAGWRIDYFIVSQRLMPRVKSADIWPEITGSDHCPVVLELADA